MPARPPAHTLRTPARADSPPPLPAGTCQPEPMAPECRSNFALAKRAGWLKLRSTSPFPLHNRRALGALARLSISATLALAVFGVTGGAAGAGYGPIGAAFRVNTTIPGPQTAAAVAIDAEGNYVVAWEGNNLGIAFANDIYAQRYSSRGTPLGAEFLVNTFTTGAQRAPTIAMDAAGDFVIAWQSAGQDGSGDGIFAQRYSSNGVLLGAEARVNSFTTSDQSAPTVAMDAAGDFVVAWQSFGQDGNNDGIYAQRYSAAGQPSGVEFHVNAATTNFPEKAAVAMDAAGDFVVAWVSFNQFAGSKVSINAQRYTSAGSKVGGEFHANTRIPTPETRPAVALDAAGDFAIVWVSADQTGNGIDVYGQRYAANGDPSGGEFRVNSYTTERQYNPAVAMDAAGDTIVTWGSALQDGHIDGVYAQRYDRTGAASGTEFNLASYSTGGHADPAIAMDAAGDFVAAWEVYNQPGPDDDIYARQYAAAAVQISLPAGGARVVEGGATASYRIALSTIPTTTVTITLTPADAQIDLGGGAGNARSLIFAADATALISQTVTIAAIDDTLPQGDRMTSIGVTVASGDANYSGAGVPILVDRQPATDPLLVAIGDNDVARRMFVSLVRR